MSIWDKASEFTEEYQVYPLDATLRDHLQSLLHPALHGLIYMAGVSICGGAIRSLYDNTPVVDVDLFFVNDSIKYTVLGMIRGTGAYEQAHTSDLAISFTSGGYAKIQVCSMRRENLEALIGQFDFTICQAGVSMGEFIRHRRFFEDVEFKTLRYNTDAVDAVGSLQRSYKYSSRGYRMPQDQLRRILVDINNTVDWDKLDDYFSQDTAEY